MGKISSLPANISKINTSLLNQEKQEKLPVGPTNSRPGPMLFMAETTAVKLVVGSRLSNDINNTDAAKISI